MDFLAWLILIAFGGYVVSKYYTVQIEVESRAQNQRGAPPGINYYCNAPVTQRPQQVWAFEQVNPCTTQNGETAPAFGPNENQAVPVTTLEI